MANNNGNNGREKIELSLSRSLNERLVSYAEENEQSVQTVAREAIEHHLDKADLKSVIEDACEKGDLRSESRVCKHIEQVEHHV